MILGVAASIELELFVVVPAKRERVDVRQLLLLVLHHSRVGEKGVEAGAAVLEEPLQVALVAGGNLLILDVEFVLELDVGAEGVEKERGTHASSVLSARGRPLFLLVGD